MKISHKTLSKNGATTVQRVLSKRFGGKVRLDSGENIQPDSNWRRIYRFKLLERPEGVPASVVVKQDKEILTEWACLEFLSEEMGEDCTVPRFYGGERDIPFIVIEDMGNGHDLYKILRGDDIKSAKTVLIEFAKALGKIHASSIGKVDNFRRIRNSIEHIDRQKTSPKDPYCDYTEKLTEICDAAGIEPYPEAFEELRTLVRFLDPCNPFHALTHADLCPVNVYHSTTKKKVYVFDYAGGHFQHVLVDGFQIRVHLDFHLEVSRFPDDIMLEMENTYRTTLAAGCSQAQDDTWFYQGVIEACVYETIRCIYRFWEPPQAVFSNVLRKKEASDYGDDYAALKTDDNYNHWGLPAVRRRVFYRLGMLAQLTEEHGYLQALGATARKIQDKFRSIWPSEVRQMPLYSVFR